MNVPATFFQSSQTAVLAPMNASQSSCPDVGLGAVGTGGGGIGFTYGDAGVGSPRNCNAAMCGFRLSPVCLSGLAWSDSPANPA